MKIETARRVLIRRGWCDVPDRDTAARMVLAIRASGTDTLNGERLTKPEREALRVLAEQAAE